MDAVGYILDGLEAALALERELGVRAVECSPDLLRMAAPARSAVPPVSRPRPEPPPPRAERMRQPIASMESSMADAAPKGGRGYDFVFLHDRPLSTRGQEMIDKIVAALGKTADSAPVVVDKPVPKAKVYVVLGALALRKFQPTLRGAPGMWLTSPRGADVLITYSPEYILRFREVTPAVQKIKHDMWQSLKSVVKKTMSDDSK